MEAVPKVGRADQTSIFHITHVENLASIIREGSLRCDREAAERGLAQVGIAHAHIKERRVRKRVPIVPVGTPDGYVPLHFAPRSPSFGTRNLGALPWSMLHES